MLSRYHLQKIGFKPSRQSLSHLFSNLHIKMLPRAGLNGDPIATPSICLQNLLLNVKNNSLVVTLSKLQKISLGILAINNYRYRYANLSIQNSMAWSSGMLVNKESTSRLTLYKLGSCRSPQILCLCRPIRLQPFSTTQVLFYQINGILLIYFSLVTCDFL